jgi:glyoxylase I family protein
VITLIHHVGFTVRDLEASAAWYERVLGFERTGSFEEPGGRWRKTFLALPSLATRLTLTQHTGAPQDAFDERRAGLDHLAFGVEDVAELADWADRLEAAGVTHSPIAASRAVPGARVLVFRDPDGIQLEFYAQP